MQARTIIIGDRSVPLEIRRNSRAKRILLRVDKVGGIVRLTLPAGVSERKALRFAASQHDWVRDQLETACALDRPGCGSTLQVRGQQYGLTFAPGERRGVWQQADRIIVGGPVEHAPKRLLRWLKDEARASLTVASQQHADRLAVSFERISIGDMRSRWGSCSSTGGLRFNWRLVLAPGDVLDYVAAHEVAHLREMNHSKEFWAHVETLVPDWQQQRTWLKAQGHRLLALTF